MVAEWLRRTRDDGCEASCCPECEAEVDTALTYCTVCGYDVVCLDQGSWLRAAARVGKEAGWAFVALLGGLIEEPGAKWATRLLIPRRGRAVAASMVEAHVTPEREGILNAL